MELNWLPEEADELLRGWRAVRLGAGEGWDEFTGSET